MRDPASAFATLGLEPGADRAAVEAAYRRLIKLHHPDRSGGDAGRAAEINRAYSDLCREPQPPSPIQAADDGEEWPYRSVARRPRPRKRSKGRSNGVLVLATACAAALLIQDEQLERLDELFAQHVFDWRPVSAAPVRAAPVRTAAMRSTMSEAAIIDAVQQAVDLAKGGAGEALIEQSRACHRDLRSEPSLPLLDRCAAFDNAAASIDDGPSTDSGRFSPSGLTALHTSAGSLLSSDYLAIEERLDRIRARVDILMASAEPAPPPKRRSQKPYLIGAAPPVPAPAPAPAAAAGADLPSGLSEDSVEEPPSAQRKLPDASKFST
jgi:hypothetical protein